MIRNILVLAMVLSGFLLNSCNVSEQEEVQIPERVVTVKARVIQPSQIEIVREYTGSLEGEKQAVLYAKIAEAVKSINVKEGSKVNAGNILIGLDKSGPGANYYQLKSLLANSEKNFKNMEYLFKEGAVSETQYDAAKTDYEVNKAAFESASKLVEIETPISGMVTSLDVAEGDFVQIGQKLATVAATSKLRVKFMVNSDEIGYFSKGTEVTVAEENNNLKLKGHIVSVANSADPVTRAFEIEVIVDNGQNLLKPGMFVRVIYIKESYDNVIVIPRKAVLTLDNKETVFVINSGLAVMKNITLGDETDGQVIVTSGLNPNDTLVTVGQDYLDDSTKIEIADLDEGVE